MDSSLDLALQQVSTIFNVPKLLKQHIDNQSGEWEPSGDRDAQQNPFQRLVVQYYQQSEIGYRKYYSEEGSIHLAINEGKEFDPAGYYTQPQRVAEQIREIGAQTVLEAGSGKGFNSRFLAQQFPAVQFQGLDLTPLHVKLANQAAKNPPNVTFQVGDFSQTKMPNDSVDIVFGVDCLCHAADVTTLLKELHRVLRPGGRLIIFDGYRRPEIEQRSPQWQQATQLVELSMALPMGFRSLQTWLETAQSVGFDTLSITDCTPGIVPTLNRLNALSKRFFKRPWRARLLKIWIPKYLCQNAIEGLLMAYTFDPKVGTHSYHQLIFSKKN